MTPRVDAKYLHCLLKMQTPRPPLKFLLLIRNPGNSNVVAHGPPFKKKALWLQVGHTSFC